jgi:ABC-type multidrug transport system fused ATPase/permease subunit
MSEDECIYAAKLVNAHNFISRLPQGYETMIGGDDGRIIERGDHESLIDQQGKYYQLYTGAFELE